MCGIVGYIGDQEAYPILIKSLKRLEYRGYDSAGIALINDSDELNVYKTKGKVADLVHMVESKDTTGHIGIAHTRWATHGEPNQINAHPHYSASGNLALIHNGIIENYATIKEKLQREGYAFKSCTDTEVLVQLIEYVQISHNLDLLAAVQLALHEVIGAYAIAILDQAKPRHNHCGTTKQPLAIGIGKRRIFPCIGRLSHRRIHQSRRLSRRRRNRRIEKRRGKLHVVTQNNAKVNPKINTIKLNIGQLEKGGYPHFMLKEIFEQSDCIKDCMRGRVSIDGSDIALSAIIDNKKRLLSARRFVIVACGTSWHAALIGKYLIEQFCRFPVEVEYASEFRYRNPVINENDVVIAISQSGETADTLAAIEEARKRGAFVYGICNAIGSSIARATDTGSFIHVGPEIGVASTKAFTGQVTVLTMLALSLAHAKDCISPEELQKIVCELNRIPDKMKQVLELNDSIAQLAKIFTYAHNFIYLGRGYNYPVALEGALKLKEISYIHAEGYPAAEMKHGPIALIDAEMPVVVIATHNQQYKKIISNIQEIKARHGKVIAVVNEGDTEIKKIADFCIELPHTVACLEPLITTIPLQLLAYHIAICKGKDVDQPRNLAKSVTVE